MVLDDVAHGARLVVELAAALGPSDSPTVIWTWSMNWRFQIGSKIPLAKRRTSMFWTVSLPR